VLLLLPLALLLCGCPDEEEPATARLPTEAVFHRHLLAVVDSYPTDGTHGYHWPRPDDGRWLGNTQRLEYAGVVLSEGDPSARCHCSGLTFEVFLRAWGRWCRETGQPVRILDLEVADVRRLQREWFGASGDRKTLLTAITKNGLGRRITQLEEAQAGDLVQLWRHSGSGHSCVFRAWIREDEEIVGLRYWSTQASTKGIGEREERFGASGSALKRDELYVVRVGAR
jgi:hypothetical protein